MNCELMLTYDTPAHQQTGSRNLTGQKTLPTIWGTYMKLVTKYQISAINSCWEKRDEKWAYMFNVHKNQQSRQTGSRNLTGPKTLPTIWYTLKNQPQPSLYAAAFVRRTTSSTDLHPFLKHMLSRVTFIDDRSFYGHISDLFKVLAVVMTHRRLKL